MRSVPAKPLVNFFCDEIRSKKRFELPPVIDRFHPDYTVTRVGTEWESTINTQDEGFNILDVINRGFDLVRVYLECVWTPGCCETNPWYTPESDERISEIICFLGTQGPRKYWWRWLNQAEERLLLRCDI